MASQTFLGGFHSVDGSDIPNNPPVMYETLQLVGFQLPTSTGETAGFQPSTVSPVENRGLKFRGYHYNPARPTPAAGGPSFNPMNTGAKDQAKIEVLLLDPLTLSRDIGGMAAPLK